MSQRVIFHVDANSAFLSWSAAYRVKVLGESRDLRLVPSVVAGDKASRHSIILAKSTPAKKYGIQTGEPLFQALEKCPELVVIPPDYSLYVQASRHFVAMLREFSPAVEQYSIDEAWVDMTGTQRLWGPPRLAAELMRRRIWEELGFTVNIGISSNKLLAKMAGDFEKPNKVHTLFPEEMEQKFYPLPVRDLFLVGSQLLLKIVLDKFDGHLHVVYAQRRAIALRNKNTVHVRFLPDGKVCFIIAPRRAFFKYVSHIFCMA